MNELHYLQHTAKTSLCCEVTSPFVVIVTVHCVKAKGRQFGCRVLQ